MSELLGTFQTNSLSFENSCANHTLVNSSFSINSVQLRQMASRVKQAGPGYEEVAALLRQSAEKLIAARIVAARRMGQPQPQLS